MRAEDISSKPLSEQQKATLRVLGSRQAAGDDSRLNFKAIPELTDEQLSQAVRFREREAKVAISVRVKPRVLEWLKSKGKGHLTRIDDILTNVMEAEERMDERARGK